MRIGDRDGDDFIIKILSKEEIIDFAEENDMEHLIPVSDDDEAGWRYICEKIAGAYSDNMNI